MRISDWSSDVCSSDLDPEGVHRVADQRDEEEAPARLRRGGAVAAKTPGAVEDIARDDRDQITAYVGDLFGGDREPGQRRIDDRKEKGVDSARNGAPHEQAELR